MGRRLVTVLLVSFGLLAALAGVSQASKTEPGQTKASGSSVTPMHGWDWLGRVSLLYQVSTDGSAPEIVNLRFATTCAEHGSILRAAINVQRDKNFAYRGNGFSVHGNVIGSRTSPREVAGFATVHTRGCTSGPWWFDAYP